METTGIIRRIDDLGRFFIPKAIREKMGIKEGQELEIKTMTVKGKAFIIINTL